MIPTTRHRRLFDTRTSGGKELGNLPEWDLSDLYASENAPELSRDLDWLETECSRFAKDYHNKLATLAAPAMLDCVTRYEKIEMIAGRIMSYAGLRYYQNTDDAGRAKFMSDCQGKVTDFTTPLVFFSLEFNRIDDDAYQALFSSGTGLDRYKPVFDRMRALKPHQLSDELEKFMHDQSVVGSSAWNKLFDETMAALEFTVGEQTLNLESTLNLLTDHDRARREAGARELARVFGQRIKLFSRVHNTLAKEKEIEDRWRKMPTPQYGRHLSNHVEPEVVEALRDAVVAAYPRLSHRYYELKRKWMGLDKLQVWDRNAPLPMETDRVVGWDEAVGLVREAYSGFAPEMAEIAEPFFGKGWIDAGVKPGKAPGAFAHPTVTDVHPYVMLNYLGKPRDVMTLAHELGHGVHQVLAARQGELLSSTPLTLAETASVFGEMLTFQSMLRDEGDPARRKIMLASKVEDMLNTVVRQVAMHCFETRVHDERRDGELLPERLAEIWRETQGESLGPIFEFDEGYGNYWAYIPHFIHVPFYVYAYAFGDCLVNALYAVYETAEAGFAEKYLEMLRAGGSKRHRELLAPFGLDASDPDFWAGGLALVGRLIDELEAMD